MTENACPECGSAMEEGFIPDASYAVVLQSAWQRGRPEIAKIFGLSNGVKLNKQETVPIAAVRCTKCGFLKLYAKAIDE